MSRTYVPRCSSVGSFESYMSWHSITQLTSGTGPLINLIMPQTQHAAKRWCFTINNWTAPERQAILDAADNFDYLCLGREHGDSGTPHLQGFVILKTKLRLRNVKLLAGFQRAHLEVSRGTPKEASDYCKKDGDYDELGELPAGKQGKRTDFEELKEWIKEQSPAPTRSDVAEAFPSLYGRYRAACIEFIELFGERPTLVDGSLRPWQQQLDGLVSQPADDRKIIFVVDPDGNKGKSWLTRYWFTSRSDIQRLSIGKRDDLAFAIDVTKKLFVFDIPRGQLEYLQYSILEQLKDQMLFSPKYESTCKILPHKVHVVVFTNEEPDRNKMTADRFRVMHINQL